MSEKIVTIFCFIDNLLNVIGTEDDKCAKISNAEVVTIGCVVMRYCHVKRKVYRDTDHRSAKEYERWCSCREP